MTQYNTLNVKLSNSQLNKLQSGIKNGTLVIGTVKISLKTVGESNYENNSQHQLLLTFENGSSANIKLSKSQLH